MIRAPRLRELREQRLLSQDDLAKKAGISKTTVVSLERGEAARFVTMRRIAVALAATPEELMRPVDMAEKANA